MKTRVLTFIVAILSFAIAGVVITHALKSRRAILESQAAQNQAPPPEPDRPPGPWRERLERDVKVRRPQLPGDPLAQNLFPPELIMHSQAQIGLTDPQRQAMMARMQELQPKFEELHQQLQEEMAALGRLLDQERLDPAPVLAQSDKAQALEREIRRTQLTLLVDLKNLLTPEQQAQLKEIKSRQPRLGGPPPDMPPAIQEKMQRLQAGIQRWQQAGRDMTPIGQAMQKSDSLIRAGQFAEAEAMLDEALQFLR